MGTKPKRTLTRRQESRPSTERNAVNAAFGILATVGGLVIYSAIQEKFKMPAEMWGLATLAAAYLFGTARRTDEGNRDQDEEDESNGDD